MREVRKLVRQMETQEDIREFRSKVNEGIL